MAGRYVLHPAGTAQFRWELETTEGEVILTSPLHDTRTAAEKAIHASRTNSGAEARYERHTTSDSQAYFVLTNGSGEALGTSRMYATAAERNEGIATCKLTGLSAGTQGAAR